MANRNNGEFGSGLAVRVYGNDVGRAWQILKKRLFDDNNGRRPSKRRPEYEKPSRKRRRKKLEVKRNIKRKHRIIAKQLGLSG